MTVGEIRQAITGLDDDAQVCLCVDGLDAAIAEAYATFLDGTPPGAEAGLVSAEVSVAGSGGMLRVRAAIATTADCDGLADTVIDDRG